MPEVWKGPKEFEWQQLRDQFKYLKSLPPELAAHFPKVFELVGDGPKSKYSMEEIPIPPYVTLRDSILKGPLAERITFERAHTILSNVLDFGFEKLYPSRSYAVSVDGYMREVYFDRLKKRLNDVKKVCTGRLEGEESSLRERSYFTCFLRMLEEEEIVINEEAFDNPLRIIAEIESNVRDYAPVLCPIRLYHIHGDLHFDNIYFDRNDAEGRGCFLIDPRGFLNGGDIAYDVGKLLHSCHGYYDFIHEGLFSLEFLPTRKILALAFDVLNGSGRVFHIPKEIGEKGGSGARFQAWHVLSGAEYQLFKDLGEALPQLVERYEIVRRDQLIMLRSKFLEAMHFCTMAPFHLRASGIRTTIALHAQGIRLLSNAYDALKLEIRRRRPGSKGRRSRKG